MQIFVRSLNNARVCVSLSESASVEELSLAIAESLEIAPADQMLLLGSRPVTSDSLYNNAVVDVTMRVLGGAGGKSQMDPAFQVLADKINIVKKVCRQCYATNPSKATTCRKRKCGRCANLRLKKVSKD